MADLNKAASRMPTVIRSPARPARIPSASARARPAAVRPGRRSAARWADPSARSSARPMGAVAGGLAGKGAAEAVNPTVEDEYWRDNYTTRPYATAGTATTSTVRRTSTAGSRQAAIAAASSTTSSPSCGASWESKGKANANLRMGQAPRAPCATHGIASSAPCRATSTRTGASSLHRAGLRARPPFLARAPPSGGGFVITVPAMRAVAVVPGRAHSLDRSRRRPEPPRDERRRAGARARGRASAAPTSRSTKGLYGEAPARQPRS